MTSDNPQTQHWGKRSGALFYSARTLLIGTLGGYVAYMLGIPLGWMLGAMALTTALSIGGMRMTVVPQPRRAMIAVIGLMVGTAFTPETLAQASEWWLSLGAVVLFTLICGSFGFWLCYRFGRLDITTAAMSGVPGGLSEMIVIAPELGGDVRSVSMVHATRLVVLVSTVPLGLAASGLLATIGTGEVNRTVDWTAGLPVWDAVVLIAAAFLGMRLAAWLRIPTPNLTGPLILGAVAHATGLTDAAVPSVVIALAQLVIGATIGQHFAGVQRQLLITAILLGFVLTVFSITLAIAVAFGLYWVSGVPLALGILALVPGGLPEMSLIAISLNADPAFVSLHHLCRVVLIVTVVPAILPVLIRRTKAKDAPATQPEES